MWLRIFLNNVTLFFTWVKLLALILDGTITTAFNPPFGKSFTSPLGWETEVVCFPHAEKVGEVDVRQFVCIGVNTRMAAGSAWTRGWLCGFGNSIRVEITRGCCCQLPWFAQVRNRGSPLIRKYLEWERRTPSSLSGPDDTTLTVCHNLQARLTYEVNEFSRLGSATKRVWSFETRTTHSP